MPRAGSKIKLGQKYNSKVKTFTMHKLRNMKFESDWNKREASYSGTHSNEGNQNVHSRKATNFNRTCVDPKAFRGTFKPSDNSTEYEPLQSYIYPISSKLNDLTESFKLVKYPFSEMKNLT